MATELPRPGVEVVQEFQSASPTIVTPTLVPCNIAPFFEVIEALDSDGTLNEDAKLASLYEQIELTIAQSSFPSPRSNIDEVDVTEATIRVFFEFGGGLIELSRESAFLTSYLDPDYSSQPYVRGTDAALPDPTSGVEPGTGYDIDGRTLILALDSHTSLADAEFQAKSNLPTSANVTVTFVASTAGGTLTLAEVVTQINALLPGVAAAYTAVNGDILQLTSTAYGAAASVVVRASGTANQGTDRLGFDVTDDTLAVGSGFYAADDSDGDVTSPRLKIYGGSEQVLHTAYPGTPQTALTSPFLTSNVEEGDTLVADGINIGDVLEVESDQLTMEVEQNLISEDASFAPRRVLVLANGLVYPAPAASEEAILTGTVQTTAASVAYVVSDTAPESAGAGTVGIGAAESLDINVIIDGVAEPTFTVSSGAGWDTLLEIIAGINGATDVKVEAYLANEYGEEVTATYHALDVTTTFLGIRTLSTNTGSGASLTVVSSTVATELGFTSLPKGDVGENIRYREGTPAVMTSSSPVTSFAGTETIAYEVTRAGTPISPTETFTLGAAATLDLCVAEWNNNARHTEAYKSTSSGVESSTGTYLSVRTRGENVGLTDSEIDLTTDGGTLFGVATYPGTDTVLAGTTFVWSTDNNPKQYSVGFIADEDDDGVSLQQVLDKINGETPNIAAADSTSPPYLELESNKVGESSQIMVHAGTANAILGFTDDTGDTGNGRPAPDLAIDISGNVILQSQLLFDPLTGIPYDPGFAPIIIAYKGLRLDLSPDAQNPSLLVIDDVTALQAAADPISTDNPGSLMTYLTLLNAPSVSVAAIGVPEISADAPDGTPLGYAKCAEFLESEEVYALATASQLPTVHQTFITHVDSMSEPEQKGERIYFFNPEIPDRAVPTLVGSGTDANSTANPNEVTIEVNIAPALIALGIDPNQAINPVTGEIENEVYLDLGGDDKYYLVQLVTAGTLVKVRTSFATGDGNDDSFYSSTALPSSIISDDWSVKLRGEQLLVTGTTDPDRSAISETVAEAATAYDNRRAFYTFPDQCGINVTGLEQLVEGYYASACVIGMVGEQPPQQGFTNFPITGLTRVVGSNDLFTNSQLNVMAAGGVYILVQDAQAAPVLCRHQLSTDLTSIETRELSITKVVDYTAKFMRAGLRNFIGRSNITQPFLDQLSTVVAGQLDFLVSNGVLIGADVNNIIQDADEPDTILIDVTLDVPFPANYIRLTLVI
jgi:hypothetical protein